MSFKRRQQGDDEKRDQADPKCRQGIRRVHRNADYQSFFAVSNGGLNLFQGDTIPVFLFFDFLFVC
jgi:hypothetical protein